MFHGEKEDHRCTAYHRLTLIFLKVQPDGEAAGKQTAQRVRSGLH